MGDGRRETGGGNRPAVRAIDGSAELGGVGAEAYFSAGGRVITVIAGEVSYARDDEREGRATGAALGQAFAIASGRAGGPALHRLAAVGEGSGDPRDGEREPGGEGEADRDPAVGATLSG
jgi:hypothetical protein